MQAKKSDSKTTSTKVMFCGCSHQFQDTKYGVQNRVHNATVKPAGWRCTVCGGKK